MSTGATRLCWYLTGGNASRQLWRRTPADGGGTLYYQVLPAIVEVNRPAAASLLASTYWQDVLDENAEKERPAPVPIIENRAGSGPTAGIIQGKPPRIPASLNTPNNDGYGRRG